MRSTICSTSAGAGAAAVPGNVSAKRYAGDWPTGSVAEHRPLGNQNRARKGLYYRLSQLRQEMNAVTHIEPDGSETFPGFEGAQPSDAR